MIVSHGVVGTAGIKDIQMELSTEVVSPREYLRIFNKEFDNIESSEIIPVKLGERGLGKIRVVRKYPIYKATRQPQKAS